MDNPPDPSEYDCHEEKPVLLPTGWIDQPYNWHPDIIELGLYRIGNLFLLVVPGEFTTMAGRQIREAIRVRIRSYGIDEPLIEIVGLSNIYTHYITTIEEYKAQRYEAGSVIYGPNTLLAYTREMENLVDQMMTNSKDDPGVPNPDLSNQQIECLQFPGNDLSYNGNPIGYIIEQVAPADGISPQSDERLQYEYSTTFVGANPRNIIDCQVCQLYRLSIRILFSVTMAKNIVVMIISKWKYIPKIQIHGFVLSVMLIGRLSCIGNMKTLNIDFQIQN